MSHDPILPSVRLARDAEPDASETTFGKFLIALRAKTSAEQSVASDDIIFTDESVELVVLSGVEVLLHRVSSQLDVPLSTRTRVLELAERVNRLLSFGMLSEYGDVQVAADAFWDQVVLLTRRAHELGYRPGMSFGFRPWQLLALGNEGAFIQAVEEVTLVPVDGSLLDYWAAPSALFFAPLLKKARSYRDSLRAAWKRLQTLSVPEDGPCIYQSGTPDGDYYLRGVLAYLSETATGPVLMPAGVLSAQLWVDRTLRRTHVLRLFQTYPATWTKLEGSVYSDWFPTQILLAMTDEPVGTDVLPSPDSYTEAVQNMVSHGEVRAVELAMERLEARVRPTLRMTPVQRELLQQMVAGEVARMIHWDPHLIDTATLSSTMINSVESAAYMDPGLALSIASGEEQATIEAMRDSSESLNHWLANVGISILWGELTLPEAQSIITADVLSLGSMVDGISACAPGIREQLADALIESHGAPALNLLLKVRVRSLTVPLLRQYVEDLDLQVIGDSLVTVWNLLVPHEDEVLKDEDHSLIWKLLARSTPSAARSFVQDPQYRTSLCRRGYVHLADAGIPVSEYMRLRTTLGTLLYERLVTGILVMERDDHLLHVNLSGESEGLSAWEESCAEYSVDVPLPYKVFGASATRDSARAVLTRISEAQARDWALIGRKKKER